LPAAGRAAPDAHQVALLDRFPDVLEQRFRPFLALDDLVLLERQLWLN